MTSSSSGAEGVELLTKHAARAPSPSVASAAALKPPHKARWFTLEYLAYFACLGWALFAGAGVVYDLSKDADPMQHRQLQPGWMFGRRVDLADGQYRFFRAELPLLTAAAAGFLVLSHAVRHFSNNSLRARLYFYFSFSFCFLLFANGSCIVFMLAIISVNYAIGWIGLRVPSMASFVPPATWIFNCVILLLNERYNGYSWAALLGVGGLGGESWDSPRGHAAQWLDNHRGLFPWFRLFNLVVLRMISFNIDRHWAALQIVPRERDGTAITFEKHQRKCVEGCMVRGREGACAWWREKDSHALSSYTPLAYFAYLFYVPLHFAGPTITFNSWLGQIVSPQQTYTPLGVVWYALARTAFIFLVLEAWLHVFYVFSFTNSTAFLSFSPYGMALVSYFTLVAIWLKFTALWRFFRLWSLSDGVEAPENMNRCVSNNYSVQSFWRGWHRSFNRWLVRYVYVPLGGGATVAATAAEGKAASSSAAGSGVLAGLWSAYSLRYPRLAPLSRQLCNVFLTFSFVAFWHDRTMQLLAWGWMIALLFVPELGVTALFNLRQLRGVKTKWYWRHIKGVGAAMSIFTMMVANLVGYSVGIHGTSSILHTMVTQGGLSMFVLIFAIFFSASMIMFECRDTGITVD